MRNREQKAASKSNSHNTSISSIRVGSTVYGLAPWIFKPEFRIHSNLSRVFLSFLFRSCTLELAKVTNKETIQRKKNIRGRKQLTKKVSPDHQRTKTYHPRQLTQREPFPDRKRFYGGLHVGLSNQRSEFLQISVEPFP